MNGPGDTTAWLEGPEQQRTRVEGDCSIGRLPTNHLVLDHEKVSRRHAIIHAQGQDEFWLVDLGSSNGTYLNGRRIMQPVQLREGDQVQVGPFLFAFRGPQGSDPAAAALPATEHTMMDLRSAKCWLLLADIESSTQLSRRLSADELPLVNGRWFSQCRQVIEAGGGTLNKYLGDGFLACWRDKPESAAAVAAALAQMRALQDQCQPAFRIVVHYGQVLIGGMASVGEETLSGKEVNFIFRMEKLASSLGRSRLLSESAQGRLAALLPVEAAGCHPLPGFAEQYPFFGF